MIYVLVVQEKNINIVVENNKTFYLDNADVVLVFSRGKI